MVDRKPPRLVAPERETLLALLQYHRESLVGKTEGLDEDTVRWSPVPTGTSLLWLVKHLTVAESLWMRNRFAGAGVTLPDAGVTAGDTLAAAVAAYRETWAVVDALVLGAENLDEPCRGLEGESPANLRWVLTHLLEETARHAGHADILRELIDGATGR